MLIKHIEGATRVLGKSQGYLGLPIKDEAMPDGTPYMVSAWEPTPDELARIADGATIYLQVWGTAHPPVRIAVGSAPK